MAKAMANGAAYLPAVPAWQATAGTVIAGQAEIDDLDAVAIDLELKWGRDRLRLLVPVPLREKFDRQRYLTNRAIWHGDLEDVRREARRMVSAWRALDRTATAAGENPTHPEVWEVALEDGSVAAIVRQNADVGRAQASGRHLVVYSLDEIGRLLSQFRTLYDAKAIFKGATIEHVRTHIGDPLDAIDDTKLELDDTIPF